MTFVEMKTDVFRSLREASTSGVYFSTEDIGQAINAGYMELSDASEWFEEWIDIDLLNNRPYYDLSTIIGDGFLSIKPAFDTSRNRWLLPSTVRALDQNDPRWERVVGTPQRIFLRGVRWLGLYPRTNAEDVDSIKQYYTRLPQPMCDDWDEPGFPEAYHIGCELFALSDLFAQDAETKLALSNWQEYLQIEAALSGWVNSRIDRPVHRVFGGAAVPR